MSVYSKADMIDVQTKKSPHRLMRSSFQKINFLHAQKTDVIKLVQWSHKYPFQIDYEEFVSVC